MGKRIALIGPAAALYFALIFGGSSPTAAEKVSFGIGLGLHPAHYLLVLAAQEKGFFKENRLEVEAVPFRGSQDQMRGFAAGSIVTGTQSAVGMIQGLARGLPGIIVAEYQKKDAWYVWVPTASPIRELKDLKGKRIGLASATTGTDYGYTIMALKALGMDKDVKLVGVGLGIPESIAALKAGAIDASMRSIYTFAPLIEKGEVRQVLNIGQLLPKEWVVQILFVHKDLVKDKSDTVRRLVRAAISASLFLRANPGWAIAKMREMQGILEPTAKILYENLEFTDGKIDKKGLLNVTNFLVNFGLITKEKAPPIDEVYSARFVE